MDRLPVQRRVLPSSIIPITPRQSQRHQSRCDGCEDDLHLWIYLWPTSATDKRRESINLLLLGSYQINSLSSAN